MAVRSAMRDNADRIVNIVVPTGAVLVLFDRLCAIPITLTAVIMTLVVVVLVLRPPLAEDNEASTPPPDTRSPSH